MSIHDMALWNKVREMDGNNPLAQLFVKLYEDKLEQERKDKEKAKPFIQFPKFTLLQMIALSPIVAMLGSWILKGMWEHTLVVFGVH